MFDIKKFFAGFNLADGEKVGKILYFVIIVALCLCGYYLITRPQQVQKITVQKGGVATIQQQQAKKRLFIPFIEGGVEKNSDVDLDTYIRGGLRFEF